MQIGISITKGLGKHHQDEPSSGRSEYAEDATSVHGGSFLDKPKQVYTMGSVLNLDTLGGNELCKSVLEIVWPLTKFIQRYPYNPLARWPTICAFCKRPKKTQPWGRNRGPAVYPPLLALPPEWPCATEAVQEVPAASISQ
ncbi:50S ribosomal protein 6, chloroplastic [Tanacetum coccineum]